MGELPKGTPNAGREASSLCDADGGVLAPVLPLRQDTAVARRAYCRTEPDRRALCHAEIEKPNVSLAQAIRCGMIAARTIEGMRERIARLPELYAESQIPRAPPPHARFWSSVRFLMTPERHQQICRKLLDNLHITAEERRELGGERVLFSKLIASAQVALDEVHFLPSSLRPEEEFEGVLVELRDNSYIVHECHEIGVGRYSPVKWRVAKDLADALRTYVRSNGGTAIDGVPIQFGA